MTHDFVRGAATSAYQIEGPIGRGAAISPPQRQPRYWAITRV
jgi:hypothetical protein